jgi:hypothetical protein
MQSRRIAALCALTFFGCVVGDLIASDHRRPFGYSTSDTFYYLTIARHAAEGGKLAFDGIHATNGFHPIWQWLLVPVTWLVERFSMQGHHLLYVVIILSALFIAGALYFLGRALENDERLTPFYGLAVFGLYGAFATIAWLEAFHYEHTANDSVPSLYGSLFHYANGMESGVLLLSFAVVAWLYVTRDVLGERREAFWFGLALAVMTLSRVDHIFIAVPILALLALQAARSWRQRWQQLAVVCLAFGVPVGVWVLSNRIWFEGWIPISGSIKSSFPHVNHDNVDRVWAGVRHFSTQSYWRHVRTDQLVAPLAVSVLYLIGAALLRPRSRMAHFLIAVAIGVLLLGTYDLFYVDLSMQGSWYVPVSTMFMSLAFLVGIRGLRIPSWTVALTLAASVYGFIHFHRYVGNNTNWWLFYYNYVPKVVAFYGDHPPHLLENDDGIVTFATRFPAMAGMGLALDPQGADAWRNGQIVPLALSRGYDRLTSANYWAKGHTLNEHTSEAELKSFVSERLFVPNMDALHLALEYHADDFAIIAITKK